MSDLKRLWDKVTKKPWYVLYQAAIDFVFLFSFGFLISPLFQKIAEQLTSISFVTSQQAAASRVTSIGASIGAWMQNPEVVGYVRNIVLIYVLMLISFYVIYSFFQGINWKIAGATAGVKMPFYRFMAHFFRINLLWVIIIGLYHLSSIVVKLQMFSRARLNIPGKPPLFYYAGIGLLIAGYFALLSYGLIGQTKSPLKKAFSLGVKRAKMIVPYYLLLLVTFFLIDLLLNQAKTAVLVMVGGILLFLPALALGRILMTLIAGRAGEH